MSALAVIFGKSEDQKRAEILREAAEDKLMAVHPLEKKDLGFHCDAEEERGLVLITRIREASALFISRSDRNLIATLVIGAVIIIKGDLKIAEIGTLIGKALSAL